jgi:hypothetical protein
MDSPRHNPLVQTFRLDTIISMEKDFRKNGDPQTRIKGLWSFCLDENGFTTSLSGKVMVSHSRPLVGLLPTSTSSPLAPSPRRVTIVSDDSRTCVTDTP